MTRSHIKHRFVAPLALAFIAMASSFEVPFPQSGAQIRSSIVSDAPSSITSSSPPLVPTTLTSQLSSGTRAEIITCHPKTQPPNIMNLFGKKQEKPVLAFLHGSFHSAWCWSEKYMPFFADKGYECVAFSLQGTGGTPAIPEGTKKVKIAAHVADLNAFLHGLSDNSSYSIGLKLGENPSIVLIGHSFGGLTIMKWLEQYYSSATEERINLAGVGLLCSVPPSGNGPMTLRYLKRSLRDSYKITVGFAMKKAIVDKALCRELFFGGDEVDSGVSDSKLSEYQSHFERDTLATIDLRDLAGKLPSKLVNEETRMAPFVHELEELALRPLVLGASDDFIVDNEGVLETGKYFGLSTEEVKIVQSPHDVMLGKKWANGAEAILNWIDGIRVA